MRPDLSHAHLKYRPEVDGLRALAVLPVILYHAGLGAFNGGFVGVDVFFVISGYLITSIIANDCRKGGFSLAGFYERRARRILPALFVVTVACLPFAWAWMLPVETIRFSQSMLATITFVPNVYFWLTTSYFATGSEKLPLLHTWSLGVEEQFYVVFPLLLWFAWRFGIRVVATVLLVLACMSFELSEWRWRTGHLSSNFFLGPTRAWELMLGALLALAWQGQPIYRRVGTITSNVASLAGLAMLGCAVFWFDKTTPTPSLYALLPTVGTSLVIACAGPGTLAYRVLASRPMVGVGLISYSAYLWHQPLFAFARLRTTHEPSWQLFCALGALALGLAYLTWRYVETPFRQASVVSRTALVRSAIGCWIVLAGFVLASKGTDGFRSRLRPDDVPLAALADSLAQGQYVRARFSSLDRDFSKQSRATKVLVVGDSFAQDFVNAIFESGNLSGAEVRTVYVSPECQIYVGQRDVSADVELPFRSTCAEERESPAFHRRASEADVIILAASWRPWSAQLLPETLQQLGPDPKRRVYVVGPKRIGHINIRELLQEPTGARVQQQQPVASTTIEMEQRLSRMLPVGTYVSMQGAVCGIGPDCRLFTSEGELISHDGVHLTKAGAAHAGRNLFAVPPLSRLASTISGTASRPTLPIEHKKPHTSRVGD